MVGVLSRQIVPPDACAYQVKHGIHRAAHINLPRTASLGSWQHRFDDGPRLVAHIAWIACIFVAHFLLSILVVWSLYPLPFYQFGAFLFSNGLLSRHFVLVLLSSQSSFHAAKRKIVANTWLLFRLFS